MTGASGGAAVATVTSSSISTSRDAARGAGLRRGAGDACSASSRPRTWATLCGRCCTLSARQLSSSCSHGGASPSAGCAARSRCQTCGQRLEGHGRPGGRQRQLAADAEVQRRSQRVQVGPRAHRGFGGGGSLALLGRLEAGLQRGHHALRAVADERGAHRVEVQQQRLAAVQQQDVARRHRAMHAAFFVQRVQRAEQRVEPAAHRRHVGRRGQLPPLFQQRRPGRVAHDAVGGAMALQHAQDAQQRRVVAAGQRLRLADEGLQPLVEALGMAARAQHDLRLGAAQRQRIGQVFLDRDVQPQPMVVGAIDHAEAALREHALDLVFVDPGLCGQCAFRRAERVGGQRRARCHRQAPGRGRTRRARAFTDAMLLRRRGRQAESCA